LLGDGSDTPGKLSQATIGSKKSGLGLFPIWFTGNIRKGFPCIGNDFLEMLILHAETIGK
jgi:hypothetical protein